MPTSPIFSKVLAYLLDHPMLIAGPVLAAGAFVYSRLQKADAAAVASLEGTALVKAHPELKPVIEEGNQILMGLLKSAYDAAALDTKGAKSFDGSLASQIGKDVIAAVESKFGASTVAAKSAVAGVTRDDLVGHYTESAKQFLQAPSGRTVVAPAAS